jgi:hypothetical protein
MFTVWRDFPIHFCRSFKFYSLALRSLINFYFIFHTVGASALVSDIYMQISIIPLENIKIINILEMNFFYKILCRSISP